MWGGGNSVNRGITICRDFFFNLRINTIVNSVTLIHIFFFFLNDRLH